MIKQILMDNIKIKINNLGSVVLFFPFHCRAAEIPLLHTLPNIMERIIQIRHSTGFILIFFFQYLTSMGQMVLTTFLVIWVKPQ